MKTIKELIFPPGRRLFLLLCLLMVFLFDACQEDEPVPAPDLIDRVAGKYACQCEVIYYNPGGAPLEETQKRELEVERGESPQTINVTGHPSLELQTETDTTAVFVWPLNYARKNTSVKFWLTADSIRYYHFDQLIVQEICVGVKQ